MHVFTHITAAIILALGAAGSAVASSPILLTDAQMDAVVAGGSFPYTDTTTSTSTESFWYHGRSNTLAKPGAPGTSEYEVTTTTTTTLDLTCVGNSINSCYTETGFNPNTIVNASSTTTDVSRTQLSGPGKSFK